VAEFKRLVLVPRKASGDDGASAHVQPAETNVE
jgi:hypothetical protein